MVATKSKSKIKQEVILEILKNRQTTNIKEASAIKEYKCEVNDDIYTKVEKSGKL
jgi:hypothetical protein